MCTLAYGLTHPKNTCIDRQALIISVDGKTRKLHLFIVKDKKAVAKQSGSSLLAKFFYKKASKSFALWVHKVCVTIKWTLSDILTSISRQLVKLWRKRSTFYILDGLASFSMATSYFILSFEKHPENEFRSRITNY